MYRLPSAKSSRESSSSASEHYPLEAFGWGVFSPRGRERICCFSVAEPTELSWLKCAGHHHKGNTDTNALQMEQFLVFRVTSRYNHRFSDRTSIPRTKASPEILQPYIFYNTGIVVITQVQSNITGPNLVK